MKILLTSGGTFGHIYPIISVAQELKQKGAQLLFVGSVTGLEKDIAKENKIDFKGVHAGKWRNYFSFENFTDLFKTLFGIIEAYTVVKKFAPDVIFAKGGYVTFPVLLWAKRWHIPTIIHESDAIPGKANRWAAKFATKICVGFPEENYKDLPQDKLIYTGTPVRNIVLSQYNVSHDKPTLLITGGSQGSQNINKLVQEILPELLKKYEIYHLVGEKNLQDYPHEEEDDEYYHLMGFSNNIISLIEKADLIISRSGANTLAEIASLTKPVILIPYTAAAGNHQAANAKVFEDKGAALVLQESSLTADRLLENINSLMASSDSRTLMSTNIHQFAKPDAAQAIAQILWNSHD